MAGATGSGLFLNGQPVDPKTLSPRSLVERNGVFATPEQWAAADTLNAATTPGGGSSSGSNTGGGIDVSAVPTIAEIQAGWGKNSSQLPSASSAESYINDWQNSATAAAQQALKAAYDSNMLTLNAAGEKIPAQYQAARNQTAAQSETQRGNFNEFAAASGLNSGAGGQAQLAMSNQLQGDLSGITQAEATAKADLELQRTQLATQYQNDIAQAIADGNQAKALALYNDYVRVDDSMVSTAQAQADENYRARTANQSITDAQRAEQLALADNLAKYGDFSGYKGIYKDEQIASMTATWNLQHPKKATAKPTSKPDIDLPQPVTGAGDNAADAKKEAKYRIAMHGASNDDIVDYIGSLVDVYKSITEAEGDQILRELGVIR